MKIIPSDKLLKSRQKTVSEKLCADCNSLCCHDLVMEISPPKDEEELNTLNGICILDIHLYLFTKILGII